MRLLDAVASAFQALALLCTVALTDGKARRNRTQALFYGDALDFKEAALRQCPGLYTGARRGILRKIHGINLIGGGKISDIGQKDRGLDDVTVVHACLVQDCA